MTLRSMSLLPWLLRGKGGGRRRGRKGERGLGATRTGCVASFLLASCRAGRLRKTPFACCIITNAAAAAATAVLVAGRAWGLQGVARGGR